MGKFKKILLVLTMLFVGVTASAQVLKFQATAYSQRTTNYYGNWSGWSNWTSCNVPITINMNNDVVTVMSASPQYYQIYDCTGSYMSGNTSCIDYKFIDQDGDRGTMTLGMKPSGQSEIYIRFSNVQWAYVVRRIN